MSRECLELPDENFATLLLEKNQKKPFKIGDTIKYECGPGYIFTDTSIIVSKKYPVFTCKLKNNIAVWDFNVTACRGVSCGHPGVLPNARLIGKVFTFPESVQYECDEGFKMTGKNVLFCTAGASWFPSLTKLKCEPITCPNLKVPENGSLTYSNKNIYNSEVQYLCNKGFRLVGNELRKCTNLGKWDGIDPKCEKVTCGQPFLSSSQTIYDQGDIVTYTQANQAIIAKCGEDGQWIRNLAKTGSNIQVQSNSSANKSNSSTSIQPITNLNSTSKSNPISSTLSSTRQNVSKHKMALMSAIIIIAMLIMCFIIF